MKILLDTDIGSDIDDAVCLAYLLAQPDAELLGITTVTGQPERRARMVSAQCQAAGRDIPIYPGAEHPLLIEGLQPEVPQAEKLKNLPHTTDFPTGEAVEFLRRTIRQHPGEITLLAIGPLTNIALLFSVDPEIPSLLKEVMLMNGWFFGENRRPEWNVKVDPHASVIVYRTKPPLLRTVGIDVTGRVTLPASEVRERFAQSPLLRPVLDFAEVWFTQREEITFHDPLAAACLFDDSICRFEAGTVEVDLNDGKLAGRTTFTPDVNGIHHVGADVSPERFFAHFFSVF